MSRPPRAKHPRRVLKTKRLLIVLGVLAAAAVVGTAAYLVQANRQSSQWAELARQSARDKDYRRAVELYDYYLKFRPKDAAAIRFELAGVYDEYARASLGRLREAHRLLDQSESNYNMALAEDADRPDERRKLARVYMLREKFELARKEIDLIRKRAEFADDPELYEMLAACDDGTSTRAKELVAEHLRAAVRSGRATPDVSLRLARLLKRDLATPKAQEEADELMRKLVADKPTDLAARLARARYYSEFGKRPLARDDIKYAYDSIPGGRQNVDVILAHADAVAAESLTDARAILDAGAKANPDNALIGLGLAEVESRSGNRAKARETLAGVFAKLPDADPLALEVGDRLMDLGDTDSAAKAADRLDANPAVAPLSGYLRGRVKLAQGDWPAAIPLLKQAVLAIGASTDDKRKAARKHKAYMALGAAYGLANDTDLQADSYHRAADADPSSLSARVAWADALARMNRTADAVKEYTAVASGSPAARVAVASLKLQEELAGGGAPGGPRRLPNFWLHVGPGPYPPELAPAVATAHAAEGRTDDAEKVLEKAAGEAPSPQVYALLAALKTAKGKDAALAVLDAADQKLGVHPDTRLARAAVLARQPNPDAAAIAALASADSLPPADRARLKLAVGELLLSLGAADKGVSLLQQAAADQPFDLNVRVVLFDWALVKKDTALRDKTLAEIRTLDADRTADADSSKGGITLVAEVMQELADQPKPTREASERMTAKLAAAEAKRKGWSRIPRMQGILASAAGNPDDAARYYEQAVALGDRSDAIVRELVRLYFRKERYADAQRVLQAVRQKGPLGAELEQQYQVLVSVAGGDPAKALARAVSREMVESKSYQDHLLRAQVLARFGKEDEAKKALDSALTLAPAVPEVYVAKLRVLLMLGQTPDKLRPEIEAAAKVLKAGNPTSPAAAPLALGQMWEVVGDTPAAVREYAAAFAAAPADRDAPALLLNAYRRTNDTAAADALLSKLAVGTNADLRRWAKRQQAVALTSGPDAIRSVPKAVKLLDENISEADRVEDKRARAFALCADPLQRKAGLDELKKTRDREPLTADDAFRLAAVLIEGANFADAEKELSNATAGGLLADPGHLVLLAQVQLARKETSAAERTVARLKTVAPKRTDVLLAEAKLLTAKGEPAKAADVVLAIPTAETGDRKALQRVRWLESVGCVPQAETALEEFTRAVKSPAERVTEAAGFYTRTGRQEKALEVVRQGVADKSVPDDTAARLMVAAVRTRPPGSAPDADRTAWLKRVDAVRKFVDDKAAGGGSGEWLLWQAELADAVGDRLVATNKYDAARDRFATLPMGRAVAQNNWVLLKVLDARDGSAELLRLINETIADVGPQPFALDTRGLMRVFMNKPAEALPDLEAATAFAATAANLFHLAVCYRKLNRDADARDALDRARLLGLTRESLHPLEARDFDTHAR